MKGYCKCGKEIDEVEFTQFGMCEGCYKKDSGGNEPCPICFGDKLDDLNQIEDEDKRYHAIQDFINELLSSGGEKCSDIELEKKEYILPSFYEDWARQYTGYECVSCGKPMKKGELCPICKPKETEKKDCNVCELYGECDHQGAYQKDGKWCYEDSGSEKEVSARHYQPYPNLSEVKSADNQSENSKLPAPKFLEGNCIYKMRCENVSETCHLECGRYHKFDLREFINVAYDLAQPKTEPEKIKTPEELLRDPTIDKLTGFWISNWIKLRDINTRLIEEIRNDLLLCRGMSYKEMVNYLVELEDKYDK